MLVDHLLDITQLRQLWKYRHILLRNGTNVTKSLSFHKRFYIIFVANEFFDFYWKFFNSKALKIYLIKISTPIQSYPMSSYCFVLIKIYYI